jgi:hypothetical protein
LERSTRRFDELRGCIDLVGVAQVGDPRHRWGYLYDERDGTGLDLRTALALERRAPDWRLLQLDTSRSCLSSPVDPNGTGADARLVLSSADDAHRRDSGRLRRLQARVDRLRERAQVVADGADRFDRWVSCLEWLPVTESGHDESRLGYLRRAAPRAGAAIDLDRSEWDDPDYQLLAFRAGAGPGSAACAADPGEEADRTARSRAATPRAWARLRDEVADLAADVDDLVEPVGEITGFDQCAYTVGGTSRADYRFRTRKGRVRHRSALVFDMRGARLPARSFLAFPGEEPPQVECNEDAELGDSDDD